VLHDLSRTVACLDIHPDDDQRFVITILWNGGEVVAGADRVGSRSGRALRGLCAGLLGRAPVSTCLLTEGLDRGVQSGEEVLGIEGADEFVALELRSDRVLEFSEHEGGAPGVEFLINKLAVGGGGRPERLTRLTHTGGLVHPQG
jgi:hypothetical protein